MHDGEEEDDSEIDDELPTFPVGMEATVEDILHVVQVVTRSQTRQQTQAIKEKDAQQNTQERETLETCAGQHQPRLNLGNQIAATKKNLLRLPSRS